MKTSVFSDYIFNFTFMAEYQLVSGGHTLISLDGKSPKVKVVEGEIVDITNPELSRARLLMGGFQEYDPNKKTEDEDSEEDEKTVDDYTAKEIIAELTTLGVEDITGKKDVLFARLQEAKVKKSEEVKTEDEDSEEGKTDGNEGTNIGSESNGNAPGEKTGNEENAQ